MAMNTLEAPSRDQEVEAKRAEAELARKKMQEVTLITQDIQSHADAIKRMGAIAYRNEGTRKAVEGHADYINGKALRAKNKLEQILGSIQHKPATSKSVVVALQQAQAELDGNLQKAKAEWERLKQLPRGPVAEVKKTKKQEKREAKELDKKVSGGNFITGAAMRAKARLRSILERAKTYSREKVTAIPSSTVRQMVRNKLEAAPLDNMLDARASVETRSKERKELIQAIENTLELVHGRTKSEFIASHLEVLTAAPAIPETFFKELEASLEEKKEVYNANNKEADLPTEGALIPLINDVDRQLFELKKDEVKKSGQESSTIAKQIDALDKEKQRLAQLQQIFNLERTLQTAKTAQEKEDTLIKQLKQLQKEYTTLESETDVDKIQSAKTMVRTHRRIIKELTSTPNRPVSGQDVEERLAHEITVQAPDGYEPIYFSEQQINDYELHPESFAQQVEAIVDGIETIPTDRSPEFIEKGAKIIADAKKLATSKIKRTERKKMILAIDYRIKALTDAVNAYEEAIKPRNFSKLEFEGFLQRPEDFSDAVELKIRSLDMDPVVDGLIRSMGQIDGGFLSREVQFGFAKPIISLAKEFDSEQKSEAEKYKLFRQVDTRITLVENLIEKYTGWIDLLPEAKGALHDESYTTLPFKRGLVQRLGEEMLQAMAISTTEQGSSDTPVKRAKASRLAKALDVAIKEYNVLAENAVTPNFSDYQLEILGRDIDDPEAVRESIEAKLEQVASHYLIGSIPFELEEGKVELLALTDHLTNPELSDEEKKELMGQIAFMLTSFVQTYEAMAEEDSRLLENRSFYEIEEEEIIQYLDKPEGFAMVVDDTLHQIAQLYHSSGDTSQLPEARQELVQAITADTQTLVDARKDQLSRKERIQIITTVDRELHQLGNEVLLDIVARDNTANAIIDHYKNQLTPLWIEKYGREPEPSELPPEIEALLNGAAIDPQADRSLQYEQLAELDKIFARVKKLIEAEQIVRLEVVMRFGQPPQLFLENGQYDAEYDRNPAKLFEDAHLIQEYLQAQYNLSPDHPELNQIYQYAHNFAKVQGNHDIVDGFGVEKPAEEHMLPLQIRNINRAIMKIVKGPQPKKKGSYARFADLGQQDPETGLYDGAIGATLPEQKVSLKEEPFKKKNFEVTRKKLIEEWETQLTEASHSIDVSTFIGLSDQDNKRLQAQLDKATNLANEYLDENKLHLQEATTEDSIKRIDKETKRMLSSLATALEDIADEFVPESFKEELDTIAQSAKQRLLEMYSSTYDENKLYTNEQLTELDQTRYNFLRTIELMYKSMSKTYIGDYSLADWKNSLNQLITRFERLLNSGVTPDTPEPQPTRNLLKEIEDALQEALDSPELSALVNKSKPKPKSQQPKTTQKSTFPPTQPEPLSAPSDEAVSEILEEIDSNKGTPIETPERTRATRKDRSKGNRQESSRQQEKKLSKAEFTSNVQDYLNRIGALGELDPESLKTGGKKKNRPIIKQLAQIAEQKGIQLEYIPSPKNRESSDASSLLSRLAERLGLSKDDYESLIPEVKPEEATPEPVVEQRPAIEAITKPVTKKSEPKPEAPQAEAKLSKRFDKAAKLLKGLITASQLKAFRDRLVEISKVTEGNENDRQALFDEYAEIARDKVKSKKQNAKDKVEDRLEDIESELGL